mgnify:CR=1 FL=1
MKALEIHAGPGALARLRERGLRPDDVGAVPAAAGGPKGLVLNPLDRFVFGDWLARGTRTVHLLGASIGAGTMIDSRQARRGSFSPRSYSRSRRSGTLRLKSESYS